MKSTSCHRYLPVRSRREFLANSSLGFGGLALGHLLQKESLSAPVIAPPKPLAAKLPRQFAKAKSVVFIFLQGGASHVDTFDPKPELKRLDGKTPPADYVIKGLDFDRIRPSSA